MHYPVNIMPYADRAAVNIGLQNRAVVPYDLHQFRALSVIPTGAQIVEKRSETKSGSLVEYSYLPVMGRGAQPIFAASAEPLMNSPYCTVNPVFSPPLIRPGKARGWRGHRPSFGYYSPVATSTCYENGAPGAVKEGTASPLKKITYPNPDARNYGRTKPVEVRWHHLSTSPEVNENQKVGSGQTGNLLAQSEIDQSALKSSSSSSAPDGLERPLPMSGIDLATLIPDPSSGGEMDPDMELLYLKHLGTSQLPEVKHSGSFLAQVQNNFTLHHSPDIPGFDQRQQMLTSLASYLEDTDEFAGIRKSSSHCATMLKKLRPKQQVSNGDAITPAHCILLCIAPFLPCAPGHNISLGAQYLRQYTIPFLFIESTDSDKNKKPPDGYDNKPLQAEFGSNQLGVILQVMAMMVKTFPTKLRQLKAGGQDVTAVIVHSKFVVHMMLTAMLFRQHNASTQNISRFISIVSYFFKHLNVISEYRGLCDEALLELTRGMLTLLSHDVAKTELLALIGLLRKTEPAMLMDDTCHQLQQKRIENNHPCAMEALEGSLVTRRCGLMRSLQALVIVTLNRCLEPGMVSYYFATLATLNALPLFSPLLIHQQNINYRDLVGHLGNVIDWMVHGLAKDSRCYTNYALLRKINDSITTTWIPGLSFQVATLAGWQPCEHFYMSHKHWLFRQLRGPVSDKLKQMPDLLKLFRGVHQLEQSSLRTMIEEDKMSREFDAEANALAKQMDELNHRKVPCKPHMGSRWGNSYRVSRLSRTATLSLSLPGFVSNVADFCQGLDFTQELADLKGRIPRDIEEKLIYPSHRFWLFTEMSFQAGYRHRELIIRSAGAMADAWCTQKKLTRALAEPKTECVSEWLSSNWLHERFTPSELSAKRLAELVAQTCPEKIALARRVMGNVLALFKLAIEPGQALLEEMNKDQPLSGDLLPYQLMIHFDRCYEAMLMIGRFKVPLEREVISHEIPVLKTRLFAQLHLRETDNYSLESSESWQTLKVQKQAGDVHRAQQPCDRIDAQELLSDCRSILMGLLRYRHGNGQPEALDAASRASSMPKIPGANPADQQSGDVDADASEHQKCGLGNSLPQRPEQPLVNICHQPQ